MSVSIQRRARAGSVLRAENKPDTSQIYIGVSDQEEKGVNVKTLIFNGSPRKNGDTARAVQYLTSRLAGEVRVVDCYRANISPCVDCRYCRTDNGCRIDDEMQDIYRYIEECSNIVIASPLYYSELTGRLLDTASRFQMYYSARYIIGKPFDIKPKRGGVVLIGGGSGTPEKASDTADFILRQIGVTQLCETVCFHDTDTADPFDSEFFLTNLCGLADFLNGRD